MLIFCLFLLLLIASGITTLVPGLRQAGIAFAVIQAMASVAGLLIPILVILIFAGDWKSGISHFTLLHFPQREKVWFAKAILSILIAIIAVLLCILTATAMSLIDSVIRGTPSESQFTPRAALAGAAPILLYSALGIGLSSVTLSPWASIATFLVATSVMDGLLGLVSPHVAPWFQFSNAVHLLSQGQPLSPANLGALIIWTAPFWILGLYRYQRADVG